MVKLVEIIDNTKNVYYVHVCTLQKHLQKKQIHALDGINSFMRMCSRKIVLRTCTLLWSHDVTPHSEMSSTSYFKMSSFRYEHRRNNETVLNLKNTVRTPHAPYYDTSTTTS